MDPETAPSTSLISPKPPLPKKFIILGSIILLAIILFFLYYFKIIKFKTGSAPAPITQIQSSPTQPKVSFACPVPKELCNTGKITIYNGTPALILNLPKETKINSSAKIIDSKQFVVQPYTKDSPVGFYQSVALGNDCYTLTYTFPAGTKLAKIELLPLPQGSTIASSSASLILQLQKRQVKPQAGKHDYEICTVTNLKPADFGEFQKLDISSLK